MSAFITSGGALLEVGCPSTLARNTEQQVGFRTTLGGKRKAFIRKGGRRAWSVDVSIARPGEVSTLEAVARGVGPYGWYGPEAVIGNLYSPQASAFDALPTNATDAGLVQLPDGSVARSVVHSGSGRVGIAEAVPVRPGMRVSFGTWALAGHRFWWTWLDGNGASLGAQSTGAFTHSGWQWRTHTADPVVGAVAVQLDILNGTAYARPSIAWGATARDELGTGCPKAIIHSPSFSPVALWEGANYTDSSYTVTEVG